jgi:hypothetical protein
MREFAADRICSSSVYRYEERTQLRGDSQEKENGEGRIPANVEESVLGIGALESDLGDQWM